MKQLVIFLTALVLSVLGATSFAQEAEVTVLTDVTILPLEEGRDPFQATVTVRGYRITGVSQNPPSVSDAVVISGQGKYLIPGLAEMHGHIPNATFYSQNLKDLLFLFLSRGVTTVRGMLGNAGQLKLQQDILDGEILGPTLYLGSPSFNGSSVSSPLQARNKVRDHVSEGWDFLKIHPGLTLKEYNAIAEEATRHRITWAGHVPAEVGLARALEAGQTTIDHMDGYELYTGTVTFNGFSENLEGDSASGVDPVLLEEAIEMTLESGAAVVPTNALWSVLVGGVPHEELKSLPELKYASPSQRESWEARFEGGRENPASARIIENRKTILKALYDAGVPILLGSDAPQLYSVPGFSIPREMENMAGAGIDNLGILRSGTINVGEFFAEQDRFGKIEPGMRADLILLNSNPLEDISNIRDIAGVMVRGIWLSKEDIEARLEDIAERNRNGFF